MKHLDDIVEYLRHCGGKDTLVFASAEKAQAARALLTKQLDAEGVPVGDRPALDLFDRELRMTLRCPTRQRVLGAA